jgi:hypothetical protein
MTQKRGRNRYVLSVLLAAMTAGAAAMLFTGAVASGSSSAAEYIYGHPAPMNQPKISGTTQVGKVLATDNGTWSSASHLTYQYRWGRCDTKGNNCQEIVGATLTKYTLTSDDVGHTIRSYVWATNDVGSTENYSDPTAVVTNGTGGTGTTGGKQILAQNVKLPNRLIIDKQTYSQSPIRSRNQATMMRIHVSDSNNNSVANALVFAEGIPYSRINQMPEVRTDANGWATVYIQPAKLFPRQGYLVMFVRARVEGQDVLSGASTRRLVQVRIAPPNGT